MSQDWLLQFSRASEQRLEAAEVLLDAGLYRDAIHLAGIAAECAVKAMILSYVPLPRRSDFVEERFRGARAHRFDYLRHLMNDVQCPFPNSFRGEWRRLTGWTVDLRYETKRIPRPEAEAFVKTTRHVIDVVRERIQ